MPNYSDYLTSISQELISIKDRVRNFIDEKNWTEDGRYKEIILRDIIANKLPDFAKCGTGFVAGKDKQISTQIDILVYRADIPLLFQKGDFVIVPKEAVLGIIEVKARLDSSKVKKTFEKAHNNGKLIDRYIFNGIFSFEDYSKNVSICEDNLNYSLMEYNGYVNNISLGKDYFLKYWADGQPANNNPNGNKYRLYKIYDLSFGYFISNLIEDCYISVQGKAVPDTIKAVLYPIENTKEAHMAETLVLD